jgi:hypothetical protein
MSSGYQQHFTTADITLLDRVLERAGVGDVSDSAGRENRLNAARFLIETFQNGVTDEGALHFALVNRPANLTDEAAQVSDLPHVKPLAPQRTRPEIGPKGGYRFGRRIEHNGTWTIYHVFSGEPALYGAWNMTGLNIRTAERALRILNAPVHMA